MMKRIIGFILFALGAIGLVVSLAADQLGIGSYPGINGAQLLGAAIGLAVALAGIRLARRKVDQKA